MFLIRTKITKYLFAVSLLTLLFGFKPGNEMTQIRLGFYEAVLDSEKVDWLEKKINQINFDSSTLTAYQGAAYALKAKNQWNPFSAISLLRKSIKKMDQAVEDSPSDLEVRFIRFAVQKNIPGYLGFSDNLNEDKEYLIKNIYRFDNNHLDTKLRSYIFYFMTKQAGYNNEEVALIREQLMPKA